MGCAPPESSADVRVRVDGLALDPSSHSPIVILEEIDGPRKLPIWIGLSEARSIAAELEHEQPLRPNTHDLAKRLIDGLDGAVERVVVTELSEGIYYALIFVRAAGRTVAVDSRPSDAIAIGLRYEAPLFVREGLFLESLESVLPHESQQIDASPPPAVADPERLI